MPLANCIATPTMVPFTRPRTNVLPPSMFGRATMLPVKVWRWSSTFGPLSKSRLSGLVRPASPCTDSTPVMGALSSALPSV